MRQKNTNRNILLFVLLSIIFYVGVNFVSPQELDIGRYYEQIEEIYRGLTFGQTILLRIAERGDFLYILALWFFDRTFLGMTFLTGCVVALYYFLVLWPFAKYVNRLTTTSLLLMLGLLCFPEFIWIITISRTTMMLIFFFIGVVLWLKKQILPSIMIFIMSILTHVLGLMFIVIFWGSIWLYNQWLCHHGRKVDMLCRFLPLVLIFVMGVLLRFVLNMDILFNIVDGTGYQGYAGGGLDTLNNQYDNYGYGTKAMMLANMISTYSLINIDKRNTLSRFLLMIFGSCTIGIMFASQPLFNRFCMCLPLFFALYMGELYSKGRCVSSVRHKKRVINIMTINSILCIVAVMLEIYSYRFWTLI